MQSNFLNHSLIGWFAIALSDELRQNQSMQVMLFNKYYQLSRSDTDVIHLNDKTEDITEQNGIIYAWHHPSELKPHWQLPVLDTKDWSAFRYHKLKARTHPQEIYENSIDMSHFPIVHQFKNMSLVHEPVFEKHSMSVKHRIYRKNPFLPGNKLLPSEFEVRLYGLGCAFTHIDVPIFNLRIRMLALATPIQDGYVDICLAVAVSKKTKRLFNFLLLPILHRIIQKNIISDFCQDIPIWENKCYYKKPLLVKGDGPIMKFRRWSEQFIYEDMI